MVRSMRRLYTPILAILLAATAALGAAVPSRAEEPVSVAVLPFGQITPRPQDEYLQAGFAETLTTALARVRSLRIVERGQLKQVMHELKRQNSGMVDEGKAAEIGKLVGARRVVVGSFIRAGNMMRVTCRFVDAQTAVVDGDHTAEVKMRLDKDEDIFELLDGVAASVVKSFGVEATAQERTQIAQVTHATSNSDAYEQYTRAREKYLLYTREGYAESVTLFEKATRTDESYALAWAGLAEALGVRGLQKQFNGEDPKPDYRRSLEAARKAVELAPKLCEAHRALAHAYNQAGEEGDTEVERRNRMEEAARKAIELNDRDAESYVMLWMGLGAPLEGEGFDHIQKALELSPGLASAYGDLGLRYHMAGRAAEAERCYSKALKINPRSGLVWNNLGKLQEDQGKVDDAIAAYNKALAQDPKQALVVCNLGNAYLRQQKTDQAMATYREAQELSPHYALPYYNMALIYGAKGDQANAVKAARKFVEYGRGDPNLKQLVEKVEQLLRANGAE